MVFIVPAHIEQRSETRSKIVLTGCCLFEFLMRFRVVKVFRIFVKTTTFKMGKVVYRLFIPVA
ncbi:hypothetical protein D3C86_806790 [compost metagenome]